MKNSDVRSACIALIRHRVGATALARAPKAGALGLQLQHGELAPHELTSLCAALIDDLHQHDPLGSATQRWVPSGALHALLIEYQRARRSAAPARPRLNGYAAADAVS